MLLTAAGRELLHLDRFLRAARLDPKQGSFRLPALADLIGEALHEEISGPARTPAFREAFLLRLPPETQRAARSLGNHLQATLAEPLAEQRPREARLGALAELRSLAAELAAPARSTEQPGQSPEKRRLVEFSGRMADRLLTMSQNLGDCP
jgi:hypothetical protein